MDSAEETDSGLVVSSGNGAILLESGEEILDEVANLVQVPVVIALLLARTLAGDHDALTQSQQRFNHPRSGVAGPVGNHALSFCFR